MIWDRNDPDPPWYKDVSVWLTLLTIGALAVYFTQEVLDYFHFQERAQQMIEDLIEKPQPNYNPGP